MTKKEREDIIMKEVLFKKNMITKEKKYWPAPKVCYPASRVTNLKPHRR